MIKCPNSFVTRPPLQFNKSKKIIRERQVLKVVEKTQQKVEKSLQYFFLFDNIINKE